LTPRSPPGPVCRAAGELATAMAPVTVDVPAELPSALGIRPADAAREIKRMAAHKLFECGRAGARRTRGGRCRVLRGSAGRCRRVPLAWSLPVWASGGCSRITAVGPRIQRSSSPTPATSLLFRKNLGGVRQVRHARSVLVGGGCSPRALPIPARGGSG
jgi:hypothetical protein